MEQINSPIFIEEPAAALLRAASPDKGSTMPAAEPIGASLAAAVDCCDRALARLDDQTGLIDRLSDLADRYFDALIAAADGDPASARGPACQVAAELLGIVGDEPDDSARPEAPAENSGTTRGAGLAQRLVGAFVAGPPGAQGAAPAPLVIALNLLVCALDVGMRTTSQIAARAASKDVARAAYELAKVRTGLVAVRIRLTQSLRSLRADRAIVENNSVDLDPARVLAAAAGLLRLGLADDPADGAQRHGDRHAAMRR